MQQCRASGSRINAGEPEQLWPVDFGVVGQLASEDLREVGVPP